MLEPKLPRSVLILNIIMIVLILVICALVINLVYSPSILGEQTTASTEATTVSEVEMQTQEAETSATSQAATSVSMTKRSSSGASSDLPEDDDSLGYSKENFKNDLFIGDSITTGLHLYNKLDVANVAASVGYTPYGAYSKYCDFHNTTALEYANSMKPDRIFIMLGSNALPSTASTEKHYEQLVDKLKSGCPNSDIYCISVTPVAKNADTDVTNAMVNEFNGVIKKICQQNDIVYLDFHSEMMGADGYANPELLAQDGVHFKNSTYDILLEYIEDNIS
ncbi:MAG: hypothetical protein E7485_09485 [Ruminococcaceae bacterium]|nr:hypothetical protein [Oscillospiraceae bacterium]